MKTGKFIVFEGLDGAGTTTQARLLAEWLLSDGQTVLETAEPSDGPIGRMIRRVLREDCLGANDARMNPSSIAALFAADRADHLWSEIEPALRRGEVVICDRYVHSSLAYQGSEVDFDWVTALNAPMRRPDLIIHLEVSVNVAGARRAARADEAEIYEADGFQARVSDGYRRAQEARPDDPVVTVNGSGSIQAVHAAVQAAVAQRFDDVKVG